MKFLDLKFSAKHNNYLINIRNYYGYTKSIVWANNHVELWWRRSVQNYIYVDLWLADYENMLQMGKKIKTIISRALKNMFTYKITKKPSNKLGLKILEEIGI